ncbi:MAG TPA: sulfatase-like hydrolase/transferase, partial [Thermoanaerobaculia bacterium]|nr:sulfatase-like hydrolase/transferase [Thermoanaerobaculia bacterium]
VATPAIDALRRDAVLFSRAWANYPLTLPSHVSMLTGLLPTEHGVRDNVGYRFDAAAHPYLPRLLAERGFATGAAVSTWLLRADSGLGEGFDFYEDAVDHSAGMGLAESQRRGSVTVERALEWLRQQQGGKFFFFLHLYEPHTPYDPPEPYRSAAAHPYDGEIALADALVGRVLDALRQQGDYPRATVILLSDHGEGLGDHGEREHGILLYREALQVPLLVKLPGNRRAGATVSAAAQLADVAPTVAALAGAPQPGRTTLLDLMAEAPPERQIYAETHYARLHYGFSDLASLVDGDLHYIEGPDPELYDLATDPGERRNVLRERRRDYATLRDALQPLRRELAAPAEADPETRERLAALGYASGAAAVGDGPLPDPKTQLHLIDDLNAGLRLAGEKRHGEAVALLRRVLAESPGLTDAWASLGSSLADLGQYREAEAAYQRAMELSGGSDHLALGLAQLYLEWARYEDARQHAELALATNPAMAHQVLAEVALRGDDWETAERHAREALATREEHIPALLQLAQVAIRRERLDQARGFVEQAERAQARRSGEGVTVGLHLVKGELLARLGEGEAAAASFEKEIELHPGDMRAYSRLALLHALVGEPQLAVATLRRMVEANESPAAYGAAVETLRVLGDPGSAGRLLRVARARFPDDPRLLALAEEST